MITYTLVADGPSDSILLNVIDWIFKENGCRVVNAQFADFRHLPNPPKTLRERIDTAVDLFPCDLLIIHRDAETEDPAARESEVRGVIDSYDAGQEVLYAYVLLVPKRMTEAWFLFDEQAIRNAAGNPNGTAQLNLPRLQNVRELPDPKGFLNKALVDATGLSGRRRKVAKTRIKRHRVGQFIDDYSPLRFVEEFEKFENSLCESIDYLYS